MRRILFILSLVLVTACTRQGTFPSVTRSASGALSSSIGNEFPFPLDRGVQRITKKPFGIFVSPSHSPIQPEKFMGYHTGTDFETFPSEKASDVVVSAVCEGTVIFAGWVKGYGGVLIQSCLLSGNPVTVLYGHMNASSLLTKGTALYAGQHIGSLGKGFSSETDGERKHLHLGVHRGSLIDFRGYVSASSALSQWINAYPLR